METAFQLVRTTTADGDFQKLVRSLDQELWNELQEDQATYDRFNKVPDIKTAIVIYNNNEAVACGCFKEFDTETVEIKRMFVQKTHRWKGVSKQVLKELEDWAAEQGFSFAVLETSIHFTTAKTLYQSQGYKIITNYGPYAALKESVCMKKKLSA